MYGYGLEGYGLYGQGYRYPPVEGYYDEPIIIGKIQKGPRSGQEIKRYPPKISDRWVATYLLNKRLAAKNKWREYATKALQEASKKYQKEVIEPLKEMKIH
jgi:DNA-binding HxlR family transcriptional regulator